MSLSGSLVQTQPLRFLGEGKVEKVNKRFMFVQDAKNGRIHVSIDAALPSDPNCVDLRDIYSVGDDVILTAVKQPNFEGCGYSACSVIRRSSLKIVQGKVVELLDKYAYVDVPKYGRIFAPFSARTEGTKYWHGKNVTVGKIISMKIFPQPEHNKCAYVAYAVYPDKNFNLTNNSDDGTIARSDRQPDKVEKKLGMIVLEATNYDDGLIYSQATGIICFSKSLLSTTKFEAGMFVYVSAIKKLSDKFEKCTWKANKIDVVGFLPFVKTDILQNRFNTSEDCVTVESHAIVCRVSQTTSSIWLWNDLLGRIFVNNHHYINDLHAMDVVFVRAQYTAAFEDVPWSAISVRPVYENADQIREEYGQLMVSDDDWKVLHVCEQNAGGFYGFMEHPTRGQCFMAWTDLNEGETAPPKGSTCRVTVYQQSRDSRHKWRALLVTQCDSNTKTPIYEHPIFNTTGELHLKIQDQILSQLVTKKVIIPSQTNGNVWTVPSATANPTNNVKIVTQHQTSSSNTSIDSGRASSGLVNDNSLLTTPVEPPPGFTTNLPIGAERAAVLINGDKTINGSPVSRTASVDPFLKINDKIAHLYARPNEQQYFNLWDPLNSNSQSTWTPLPFNLTDTANIDTRRKSIGIDTTPTPPPTMGYGQQMKSMLLEENGRSNGHTSFSEAIKYKIQHETANDQYEQFLCDEINKRPHLLMKLISSDEKARQYILSMLKQQTSESDSNFTAF